MTMASLRRRNMIIKNNYKSVISSFVIFTIIVSLSPADAFFDNMGSMFGNLGDQMSGYIDGLYQNLDSWAEHVINHAKTEDCFYICPNGKTPSPNSAFKHESTGCGTFGIKIKTKDLPVKSMGKCCDDHQTCYHKCGENKNKCDELFQKCLIYQCSKKDGADTQQMKACETAAKMLFMGVLTFGCKTYKDAQKLACICSGTDEF